MGFIQLEEHCVWFLVHTGDAEFFSKIAVNASSTLLDHHWLSFIQVLGWALMTNSQSQDLITILAKVKWWVMLCFFQVEQIIHKCCLGVEFLHLHASTSPPTWFRVQQFRISMDLLLCCQVGKVVAREYESNSSRSVFHQNSGPLRRFRPHYLFGVFWLQWVFFFTIGRSEFNHKKQTPFIYSTLTHRWRIAS